MDGLLLLYFAMQMEECQMNNVKNPNGEGSLRQRSDGRWEYRIKVDGRTTPMSFYSMDKDGRGAKKKYREWLKTNLEGSVERVKTVKDWAALWLQTKKAKVVYGTYANYERYTNDFILPAIGTLKMDAVRPYHIDQIFSSSRVTALSDSAKNEIRVCLNGIFKSGKKNRLCRENPMEDAEQYQRSQTSKPKVYTLDQVRQILAYAPTHKWGCYLQAALFTGLRTEELCALMWSDLHLDEDAPYIRVHNVIAKVENVSPEALMKPDKHKKVKRRRAYELREMTKSKRERIVALTDEGVQLLRALPKESLFVFAGIKDAPFLTPPQFAHRYSAVLRDLNYTLPEDQQLPMLSPHKARHTYASRLLDCASNISVVQEQLGHARLSTTQIYLHVDMDTRKANVSKMSYG